MAFSIVSLDVHPDEATRQELEKRFRAAFQVYRATMRECLRRLDLCRESKDWQKAHALPKGKVRSTLFRSVSDRYGFNEYGMNKYAGVVRNSAPQLKNHLSNMDSQAMAKRVWNLVSRHLNEDSAGRRFGRPSIPTYHEFYSVNSACGNWQSIVIRGSYAAGQRPKGEPVSPARRADCIDAQPVPLYFQWGVSNSSKDRILLPLKVAHSGTQVARHEYYLGDLSLVNDVQLVRTLVQGRWQYNVHVKAEKEPYRKPGTYDSVPDTKVGIDLGPSTLALVSDHPTAPTAELYKLTRADTKRAYQAKRKQRRLQRAQERSRIAANPDCYDEKGRRIKGRRVRVRSKTYQKRQSVLRDMSRRTQANAIRREQEIARHIVTTGGKHVVTEDLKLNVWARRWGRSLLGFAPSRFLDTIKCDAIMAGGSVRKVNTYTSALSSHCVCGKKARKPLWQRTHECACGVGPVDRDLFSAFLCLHLMEDKDVLDASQALAAWAGAERLLDVAASNPVSKLTNPTHRRASVRAEVSQGVSSHELEGCSYPTDVVGLGRGQLDVAPSPTAELVAQKLRF